MFRWFGARLLLPAELPELFNTLIDVCNRARLSRLPDIYCLPGTGDMNAYALGGPEGAAIILTEGLIRRMTRDEVASILAHEVAHIRNNDAWTMSWAAALHRSIEWTSLTGLALLRATRRRAPDSRPLAALLRRTVDRPVASFGAVAYPRAGCGCYRARIDRRLASANRDARQAGTPPCGPVGDCM